MGLYRSSKRSLISWSKFKLHLQICIYQILIKSETNSLQRRYIQLKPESKQHPIKKRNHEIKLRITRFKNLSIAFLSTLQVHLDLLRSITTPTRPLNHLSQHLEAHQVTLPESSQI